VTLSDAIQRYTADGARMALADAGDSLDDANFVTEVANGMILKLTAFIDFVKNRTEKMGSYRSGPLNLFDQIIENSLNNCIIQAEQYYRQMAFRQALNSIFFELQGEAQKYELQCGELGPHRDVLTSYLRAVVVMLMPIAPHTSEYLWSQVMLNSTSVMKETFPVPSRPVDIGLRFASKLIEDVSHDIRTQVQKVAKKRGPIDTAIVYVAPRYAEWQVRGLEALRSLPRDENGDLPKDAMKMLTSSKASWMDPKMMQDIMAFLSFAKGNADKYGDAALATTPPCNDVDVLAQATQFLKTHTGVENIIIFDCSSEAEPVHPVSKAKARPGQPQVGLPPEAKK